MQELRASVLVTGGAGFLGINLCRYLLTRGMRIRSMDIAPFDYPERDRVEIIRGDIRNVQQARQALDGIDIVVHAAAALAASPASEIYSIDVVGTRVLLEAAAQARVSRFIFVSTIAAYGTPDHVPLLEEDDLRGVGPYGGAKIDAEKACFEWRDRGLCAPVLRPTSFVGPERLGVFELLYDFAYDGRNFPVLGSGENRYQLMDVEDLCQAIHLCMTYDQRVVNDTFNVGAADFGTLRDSFQAVLDRAGHGKRVIGLPAAPAICALRVLERLHLSPIYQWIYETAVRDNFMSIRRIVEKLGFQPKYSNRDALIRNYDWYVTHRDEVIGTSGVSHRVAWRRGALSLAKRML